MSTTTSMIEPRSQRTSLLCPGWKCMPRTIPWPEREWLSWTKLTLPSSSASTSARKLSKKKPRSSPKTRGLISLTPSSRPSTISTAGNLEQTAVRQSRPRMMRSRPSPSATVGLHPSGQELRVGQGERVCATHLPERLHEVEDRGLLASGDVDRAGDSGLRSEQIGLHDVRHVDPVPRLAPVAEDVRGAAVDQATAEDRDHARLAM